MTTIKNFDGFKKSLLQATSGTMVESFDSSNMFGGCEYQSYRVYVDAIHYYNMFVIHNFATNTYDVALETACCGTSTMSRKIKTQKALIESVVAWISCNYLNTKKIDSDSEEYTDMCEETNETENAESARGNDVFDGCKTVKEVMEVKQELNARFGKEQYFDTDTLQTNKAIIENINHCPNQNTCCIVSPFVHCDYNYKSDACIKAHKNFIHHCEQVHKHMKAINNPEWHHVRLAKLANIDIDTLDEKRQRYLKIYKELIKTVNDLHKCKTAATYENRLWRFRQVIADDINFRGTTLYMTRFLDSKISMCNVECGLWSSADEKATSFIKSRRYRHTTLK